MCRLAFTFQELEDGWLWSGINGSGATLLTNNWRFSVFSFEPYARPTDGRLLFRQTVPWKERPRYDYVQHLGHECRSTMLRRITKLTDGVVRGRADDLGGGRTNVRLSGRATEFLI